MELEYRYWYFQKALSENTCDDIIYTAKKQQEKLGLTGTLTDDDKIKDEKLQEVKKIRDSNVVWLNDRWIYDFIHPYVHQANANAGWNYEWRWSELFQFTIYNKNQHYDWHCDSWDKPYEDGKYKGLVRKLSVTISLSDPSDYDGGNLEFYWSGRPGEENKQVCEEIRPRGSIIVFPSFVYHRVVPVTRGTRYSLVLWNLGDPFK